MTELPLVLSTTLQSYLTCPLVLRPLLTHPLLMIGRHIGKGNMEGVLLIRTVMLVQCLHLMLVRIPCIISIPNACQQHPGSSSHTHTPQTGRALQHTPRLSLATHPGLVMLQMLLAILLCIYHYITSYRHRHSLPRCYLLSSLLH